MKYKLLSNSDLKAIDSLIEFYGGAEHINSTIAKMRDYETRKKILSDKGYGPMIDDAETLVKRFPKFSGLEKKLKVTYDPNKGVGRSQVSGFQGSGVTYQCMKRMAETTIESEPCFVPAEMISVVPLTDHYVYSGDLMATLTMAENIMKTSKFCSTNLIGIPNPESRFANLEKVLGEKFDRKSLGEGLSQLILKNQGTPFGNFGGIEVANNNHLFYLDGVVRTAMETGADFFLNPSWSTIIAACYFGREMPDLSFKISMLLSTQNAMQLRMLLNIINEYLRDDNTTPIFEINIGNGATAETFIQCATEEFEEKGMAGARMQDIANRAGINKALLHYYFRTKDKLLEAVFDKLAQKMFKEFSAVFKQDLSLEEKINFFFREHMTFLQKNPKLPMFILREVNRNPELLKKFLSNIDFDKIKTGMRKNVGDNIPEKEIAHLMVSIVSLSVFPVAARPIIEGILELQGISYKDFIEERKEYSSRFILSAVNNPEHNTDKRKEY